jgi:LAO/AO transport system kinase
LAGDRGALARLISWAEDGEPGFPEALAILYPKVGHAWRVGVTGPPGAGKSTLVSALAGAIRARGLTLGILAIDPSSPFTGGALLGDRIRMEERTQDQGVFIRSMATRGSHGGLARAASDACDVMDASGFDMLVLETVGVGQAEYDVVGVADTVVVVLCPGAGDGVQAMKAGILEVADVLVVNKADLPGADGLSMDLEDALRLRSIRKSGRDRGWSVRVLRACASTGEGVEELLAAVLAHQRHLEPADLAAARLEKRVRQVRRVVAERLEEAIFGAGGYGDRAESSLRSARTPYDVAVEILSRVPAAPALPSVPTVHRTGGGAGSTKGEQP